MIKPDRNLIPGQIILKNIEYSEDRIVMLQKSNYDQRNILESYRI